MNIFNSILSVFYPQYCPGCDEILLKNEIELCTQCLFKMPRTNYHLQPNNPLEKAFWGRVDIHSAASFIHFSKGGRIQNIIHDLKYNGNRKVGTRMGEIYGAILMESERFNCVEMIIPVPLHQVKERLRGFNQSSVIVDGLVKTMKKAVNYNNLIRIRYSDTQTRKNRLERWENVDQIFKINKPEILVGKHILLVDDIITTGATIEACANVLLKVNGVKVSVVSLGCLI